MDKQKTVEIKNLSIGYRSKARTKVVGSQLNASVLGGELTCLLGANGVGKSTLLRTLSAFQPKLSGNSYILGKEIGEYTAKELAQLISVVLTEKLDINNMSVRELVGVGRSPYTGFWGTLSKSAEAVVENAISLVKTENLAGRVFHSLSAGEQPNVRSA